MKTPPEETERTSLLTRSSKRKICRIEKKDQPLTLKSQRQYTAKSLTLQMVKLWKNCVFKSKKVKKQPGKDGKGKESNETERGVSRRNRKEEHKGNESKLRQK